MDFTLSLSSDWFNLMSIPLILVTLKDVIPRWKMIWDDNLTMEDRRMLMRIVIFLALPAVVLIHELGHLFAAFSVGAKVYEFHYGPVTGHVDVDANIAPWKLLWIAVAGNLAQVVVGLISLVLATIVRSAAMTVFLVYLGLYSIGGTVIFYAALSIASYYGDWKNIYESPCSDLVFWVGIVHGMLVSFVVYCVIGGAPRLWFTRKTVPGWSESHQRWEEAAKADPSVVNMLALSNSFKYAGLFKEANACINKADAIEPESPSVEYARAEMELAQNNPDKALKILEKLAQDDRVNPQMKALIVLQIGDLWMYRRDLGKALKCFEAAANLDGTQGDARLRKAMLKSNANDYFDLDNDLLVLKDPNTNWVYRSNQEIAPQEIVKLETISARRKQGK